MSAQPRRDRRAWSIQGGASSRSRASLRLAGVPPTFQVGGAHAATGQAESLPGRAQAEGLLYYPLAVPRYACPASGKVFTVFAAAAKMLK